MGIEERFWSKVRKTDGCWEWTACTNDKGYGAFGIAGGRYVLAHRFSWTLASGSIPDGLCVLHTCDTPGCVNPKHLWLGTRSDNNSDRTRKHRTISKIGAFQSGKTNCPQGHKYDFENTTVYIDKLGRRHRDCRSCDRHRTVSKRRSAASTLR